MNDAIQQAVDSAYAVGIRGLEVAKREHTTLAQALALSLAMGQLLAILSDHRSVRVGSDITRTRRSAMTAATKKRKPAVKRFTLKPKRNFRTGETAVVYVDAGSRPSVWVGSEERAGLCWLTRSEMVELRDALNRALGEV